MTQTVSIEEKAIQDWKRYPGLAKIFKGPDEYCDYLKQDFGSLISKYMKERGCSRSVAIRETARANPELHGQWIAVVNIVKGEK